MAGLPNTFSMPFAVSSANGDSAMPATNKHDERTKEDSGRGGTFIVDKVEDGLDESKYQ